MSRARSTQLATELAAYSEVGQFASLAVRLAQQAWRDNDVIFPRPGSPTLAKGQRSAVGAFAVGEFEITAILDQGSSCGDELDVFAMLVLLGGSAAGSNSPAAMGQLAPCLLWHETYSALKCLSACGTAFDGGRQRQMAEPILSLLESADGLRTTSLSPSEYSVARAWLISRTASECVDLKERALKLSVRLAVPGEPQGENQVPIVGELGPKPRSALAMTLMALSGVLLLLRGLRLVGRLVLLKRATTTLWLTESGLELLSRQELLGKVVREQRVAVPMSDIRCVAREVKYPRASLYAGLFALAIGTILGVRLFIDGLRVPGLSFTLIALGLGCVAAGVLLDLVVADLGDTLRGRCRLVVLTHSGQGWNVGALEPTAVDRLLTQLLTRLTVTRSA